MSTENGCANCTKNKVLKADFFTLQTTAKVVIYNHRARAKAQNTISFMEDLIMATTTMAISNEGIMNLLTAMCEQAHEDLQPKSYTVNFTKKKAFKESMAKYKTDKENARTAAQWLEYMKDVFVR